jgi:biopolymer transport protein TolR
MLKNATRRRPRRRLLAEINIVPYIDVMLVLLVIFMVTAPLITLGVKVNLPQERAGALASPPLEAVVITVDSSGRYFVDLGSDQRHAISERTLLEQLRVVLTRQPQTPILVRADQQVEYGRVVRAMVIAQTAGAAEVGLITAPPERTAP